MRRRFSGISDGRRVHRRGGVVHQDFDRATELFDRFGHDAGAVVAVGEVGTDDRHRDAVRTESLGGFGEAARQRRVRVEGAGDDGDRGTLGREPFGDRRRRCRGWHR